MQSNSTGVAIGLDESEIEAVRRPLAQAALLPAKVYSDPHLFRLERDNVFARNWLPVCHVSQLTQPGAFVTRKLINEPVIAVRNRDGNILVMSNVCRHRNTILMSGSGTCKAGRIVCPYHGWAYSLDGRLASAPHMDQALDFSKDDVRLPILRSAIWHGFVFVNIDGNAPSLTAELAGIEPDIAPYRFEDMEIVEIRRRTMPWNWKISLENFSEAYHQPLVHPKTADHEFPATMAEYQDVSGPYGLFSLYQRNREIIPTFFPAAADMPDKLRRSVTVFNLYPYFHCLTDASTPLVLDFNVLNENEHELIWSMLLPKGSLAKPDIEPDISKFKTFIEPILLEDVGICTGVGEGVHSRFTIQGRLSHMEKTIYQFHNWWLDAMLSTAKVSST